MSLSIIRVVPEVSFVKLELVVGLRDSNSASAGNGVGDIPRKATVRTA